MANFDFTPTAGNAITVEADHVIIDFADHTLSYAPKVSSTAAPATYGVYSNGYGNITVRNGTVSGFYIGVTINSGTNSGRHLVSNVTADNCYFAGVQLDSDIAELRDCRAEGCGGWGLWVDSANVATVDDCQALNCTGGPNGLSGTRGI